MLYHNKAEDIKHYVWFKTLVFFSNIRPSFKISYINQSHAQNVLFYPVYFGSSYFICFIVLR